MEVVGPYLFLPFAILLLLGLPVAAALGTACAFLILFSGVYIPPIILVMEMHTAVNQFAFLALPMFVLTGELLNRCDLTEKLVEVARLLVGWLKGGLGHVNIVTSMFFAGISGSVLADTASIGPILIPAMIRENYPRAFSAAVTASSSVIGAIIPPSIPMIIIGGQLGISVGGLFAGGLIPGFLVGLALMSVTFFISSLRGYGDIHRFEGPVKVAKGSFTALPALFIPVLLLGGILGGVFTPTEAGAVAALYTLLVGTFYYRTLTWRKFIAAVMGSVRITGSAMLIVAAAFVFSKLLTFFMIPQEVLDLLLSITDNRTILILIIIVFFLVMGTFMDAVANMIILGPLLMPVMVNGLGMHEIQFGIFLMFGLLLGLITPPLGLCLFVASPIARVSIERTAVAVIPFLLAEIVVLLLIAFVPEITVAIPRALGFS